MAVVHTLGPVVPVDTMTEAPGGLEEILGHTFGNRALLRRAVTHRSAAARNDRHAYQRLEFLGDRILGAAVATMVFRRFPGETEGELSVRLAGLVCNESLAEVALERGIDAFVVVGKGEEESGLKRNPAILADVLEALIGALYVDGGFARAHAFVRTCWQDRLEGGDARRDAKTRLQERAQGLGLGLPRYTLLEQDGPSHAPLISVEVRVEGFGSVRARGASRRAAEREAAGTLLERMAC